MEAVIFVSGITFVAGMVVRSLFTTQPPPQIIYVKPEPVERGDSGCHAAHSGRRTAAGDRQCLSKSP
jgi:hypothetical protein